MGVGGEEQAGHKSPELSYKQPRDAYNTYSCHHSTVSVYETQ